MNLKDKEKQERLFKTFERNFRLTRLYAAYLEGFPEIIKSDMIKVLTEDERLTQKEAIVGLLTEIFGLDFENTEDRILIRDYITPSVRLMDAEKYRNNPYYKNIKIPETRDGEWELRWEEYAPYRGVIVGDMEISDSLAEYAPLGFFTESFRFPAVLEGGNEWMTLTPVDLDTSDEAIEAAHGKVVTFGLGLGYYAYMVSEKDEVDSITVIEKSPDVIRLFEKYILPQFSHPEKVRVICADAFEYAEQKMPAERFDLAFVDTWRDASDGAPMYERMKKLEKTNTGTRFLYWIENFLISRHRALRFSDLKDRLDSGENISYDDFHSALTDGLMK